MGAEPLSGIDLVQLSDIAWQIVDPDGAHEAEEEMWTTLLHAPGPHPATRADLDAHLDEVVTSFQPPAPAVPLRAVAAVTTFLAAHPERRQIEDAVLRDALNEHFGRELPADVAAWLARRDTSPAPRQRQHGARQPRRTLARPSPPDTP